MMLKNELMVLSVSRISSLILLCSSIGILQVTPLVSTSIAPLLGSFPFGQHKHIRRVKRKLLPRPTTFQPKQGQQTSQAITAMLGAALGDFTRHP